MTMVWSSRSAENWYFILFSVDGFWLKEKFLQISYSRGMVETRNDERLEKARTQTDKFALLVRHDLSELLHA